MTDGNNQGGCGQGRDDGHPGDVKKSRIFDTDKRIKDGKQQNFDSAPSKSAKDLAPGELD